MKIIYIDSENKCHSENDGTMVEFETDFFDDKCDTFINGYKCEVYEDSINIYPCKPYRELEQAQRIYEKTQFSEIQSALTILLGEYSK